MTTRTYLMRLPIARRFIYFGLSLFLLGMDYRRKEGDESSFVVITLLGSFLLMTLCLMEIRKISRRTLILLAPFPLFIITNSCSAFARGHEVRYIISANLPLAFLFIATLATANLARSTKDLEKLLTIISIGAIFSALFRLIFGLHYTGLDIGTIRYQILSASLPLLFSYGIASLALPPRRFYFLGLAITITAVALAVTRTYIAVLLLAPLSIFLSLPNTLKYRATNLATKGVTVLILTIAILTITTPSVIDRWVLRVNHSNHVVDITALSRIAEANFQIEELQKDWTGLFFGFGVTAQTSQTGPAKKVIQMYYDTSGPEWHGAGYGHILYVGIFFVGGLISGSFLLLSIFWRLFTEIRSLRRSAFTLGSPELFARIVGVATLASFLGMSAFSGIFGDRGSAVYFGIALGLTLIRLPRKRQSSVKCNEQAR